MEVVWWTESYGERAYEPITIVTHTSLSSHAMDSGNERSGGIEGASISHLNGCSAYEPITIVTHPSLSSHAMDSGNERSGGIERASISHLNGMDIVKITRKEPKTGQKRTREWKEYIRAG
nr:hypothetical protein [Tanacetum cinerariifolium]